MAAEEALVAAGVSPQARGESLTVEEFARIAEAAPQRGTTPAAPTEESGNQ
jgi:16S rRNA (adenine1518-N6/adenine1519-N6)-dimethyltransferase